MKILTQVRNFLGGEERSALAKKNILASLIFKVIDIPVYLALVPVTINYLNEYEYGIWLTLSSIILWIDTFDIGLGNVVIEKYNDTQLKIIYGWEITGTETFIQDADQAVVITGESDNYNITVKNSFQETFCYSGAIVA